MQKITGFSKLNTLKANALLGGENVELNFLHSKVKIVKEIIDIENKKVIEYELRKEKILECINEYLSEYEED